MGCCGGSTKAKAAGATKLAKEQNPFENVIQNCPLRNPNAQHIFKVLVVYTRDCAEEQHLGLEPRELAERIATSIDQMNEAFVNSALDVQGKLVAIEAIEPFQQDQQMIYAPLDMYKDEMLAPDGQFAGVHALRAQHEAHVVMVVVNSQCPGDAVGGAMPATRKNQAFVVLKFNQLVLEYTPAHEIGHLFGAGHEVGPYSVHNHPLEDGEFALGHVTEEWRTIMAYLNRKDGKSYGAEVIPHFSNPDVQYNGTATGTAQANNAKQIREYAPTLLSLPD